jgi:hypothetical protein
MMLQVLRLGTSYLTRIVSDHMTNPIAVNMSDRIWNDMQDIIKAVGWAALGESFGTFVCI